MKNFILLLIGVLMLSTTIFAKVDYQHIRNATAKINYNGTVLLIDPMLAPKNTYPGFEGTVNSQLRFPFVDLPISTSEILKGVDAVIVTHTHLDHWDEYAANIIPKNIPIFVQNKKDYNIIKSQGFSDVRILEEDVAFKNLKLTKTGGAHGTIEMYASPEFTEIGGDAMGVVIQSEGEMTTYIMGDTIWTADVNKALNRFKPEFIVMNTGAAHLLNFKEPIIMGKEDVEHAVKFMPNSKIIAVHMDTVNHTTVSRKDLREFIKSKNIEKNVFIPKDGEIIKY